MTTTTESKVRLFASARMWIDSEAVRQLYATAQLPGLQLAVGFPDLQPGRGTPVGAAFVTDGMIYPHLIGSDVGCGMALFKTDLLRRKARLDRWAEVRFDLEHPWEGNTRARLTAEGLCATQGNDSFGTLGGGNHFAELQAVEKIHDTSAFNQLGLARDELVALVHSGSRDLGAVVLETYLEEHGVNGVPADSDEATEYLLLHDHAVNWAQASRALVAERLVSAVGGTCQRVLDSCHNAITCHRRYRTEGSAPSNEAMVWIHRRGAAPSNRGPLVIPGSRGTFSYLVQPTDDQSGNAWSVAHGAGRKWMRSESRLRVRERFHRDELVQTPLGGHVICEERDLLYEEAPMAYKNIEAVIGELVDAGVISIIATLRPLLTYKVRKLRR
jgi:release factor H-coupled RctB family protein